MKTQFGIATEGDLVENTITIRMDKDIELRAGKYALVPIDEYEKLVSENKTNNESVVCQECKNPYPHIDKNGLAGCEECGNTWQT